MRYWNSDIPTVAGYYYAVPKDKDSWLDGTPEIVYVIFDGQWHVYRPGYEMRYKFEDFSFWGSRVPVPQINGLDYLD
jgi:hypothetical protein